MMVDQQLDQRIGLRTARLHRQRGSGARVSRAVVGLLAGVELGVDEKAVLEIVDAELGRFGIGHRA